MTAEAVDNEELYKRPRGTETSFANDKSREVEKGYLNNPYLPLPGHKIEWAEEKLNEYIRCKEDPIYFAETYFTILTADGDEECINLFDFQKEAIETITNNRKMILCTSRQVGKTTVATVVILHAALFNSGQRVALLANKGDQAREILDRIQLAFEMLPTFLKIGVKEWNKGSVVFENRSKIVAAATSSSVIRGKSQSMVYIDETAFVDNWKTFSASVLPTLSSSKKSKTIFTSTPNGLNHFHKYWVNANKPRDTREWNGYHAIEVPWYKVPGRDEEWKHEVLSTIDFDMEKFRVEYECEFMGSSGALIAGHKIKELAHIEPVRVVDGLRVFKAPREEHTYAMICDVAEGKGLDYSAFQIIDISQLPYEQVAVYSDNMITPIDYASLIFRIAKTYNEASVLIESNNIGYQVCNTVYNDYSYENILFSINKGRKGKVLYGPTSRGHIGIKTTKTVKAVGCSMIKMIIESDKLIINDYKTIQEIATFSKHKNSYEAEPGCHDDMVMCLVLFGWVTDQEHFKFLTDIDTLSSIKEKTEEQLIDSLLPFGFMYDGVPEHTEPESFVDADGSVWCEVSDSFSSSDLF